MIKKKCPVCGGKKVVQGEKTLDLDIEPGMPDQYQIVWKKRVQNGNENETDGRKRRRER